MKDVARIELGALNYQQIGRVNGQPGVGVAVFQAPGSNALAVAAGIRKQMDRLRGRFPNDLDFIYTLDTTLPVSQGIKEIRQDAGRGPDPGRHRRLPVPAELARDADSDARRARVADRHVRRVPAARLLDQHAVAVRPRARDRPGRRRRDRGGRGGGTSHRRRDDAARCNAQGDGGSVRAGHRHRADPGRCLHPSRRHEWNSGAPEPAVRDHYRGVGR